MSRPTGPTSCLRHSFALGDSTVIIDWRQIKKASGQSEEEISKPNSKARTAGGPPVPGKGAATFASIVQDLEARYAGRKSKAGHGYNEGDGFIVDDEEDSTFLDESTELAPSDFFVTQGPTERRKRPHNEVLPGPIGEDTEDIAKKRKKLQEDLSDLPAPVRDALVTFEETWSTFVKGKPLGRFPTELEGALQSVGQVAMANHPKGFLSNDIIEILQSITGFSSATLKPRIRKGSSEPGHVAGTSEKTGSSIASPTHAEAVAYLQSLGGEFSPVLDLPLEETRSSELQKLMEKHIEELSTIVKAFAASFSEPPKRSPWNDAIKNKIKLLFAINDSIVPPPVNASTLRTHLLSLWPPEWEVKDTQIKPLTRYFKPPTTKSAEPDGTPTKTA